MSRAPALAFPGIAASVGIAAQVVAGIACLLTTIAGCATGSDITPRGMDGGRRDGEVVVPDAETGVCDPPCAEGEMCAAGTCVPASDADGDGVDGTLDCDDTDPTVSSMSERECAGPCGAGVERCTDGAWEECTAPSTCDCEVGAAPRMIPCMRCGMQRQMCTGGTWQDDGACTGAGPCSVGEIGTGGSCGNCGMERRSCGADCSWGAWACEGEGTCMAGAVEAEMQSCGSCGTGSQTRTRTCSSGCAWDAWSAWGTCTGGGSGICTPGMTETGSQACGSCGTGTQSRSRSCDATTCDWGAWSAFGACSGGGACAPGATRACANGDACGHEVCSGSCTWGGCQPTTPTGCLRIRPGTAGPPGNNYRCCDLVAPAGGDQGWQFCLSSCAWSMSCEATTSC